MNRKISFFIGALSLLTALPQTFADEIENLKVTQTGSQINISWDPVTQDVLSETQGYALQWGIYQNQIRVDKSARKFINQSSLNLRKGTFDTNQVYYFRVYTYSIDGRVRSFGNGSKILKWKINTSDEVESSYIAANDPVIADNSSTTSTASVSKFGTIRTVRFDNFSDISWSRPSKLAKQEYDGFAFDISKSVNMADPVLSFDTAKSVYKARIKNLNPATQYYVRGYFYKNTAGQKVKFGASTVKPFKTIRAIDRTRSTRASRNIKRIEKKNYFTATVGGETTTSTSNTTTSNSTSTSNTSASIPSVTKPSSTKEIQAKITELTKEIKKLQKDLRSWKKQLRDKLRAKRSAK